VLPSDPRGMLIGKGGPADKASFVPPSTLSCRSHGGKPYTQATVGTLKGFASLSFLAPSNATLASPATVYLYERTCVSHAIRIGAGRIGASLSWQQEEMTVLSYDSLGLRQKMQHSRELARHRW